MSTSPKDFSAYYCSHYVLFYRLWIFSFICSANSFYPQVLTLTPEANTAYNRQVSWQGLAAAEPPQVLTSLLCVLSSFKYRAPPVNLFKTERTEVMWSRSWHVDKTTDCITSQTFYADVIKYWISINQDLRMKKI